MEVESRLTYALDKSLLRLLNISNMLKMCPSTSFMMSSLAQLSAAFSVLLAAATHFTQTIFQHNKQLPQVNFAGKFWV